MATRTASRRHPSKQTTALPTKLLPIKGTPDLHRRLRIAAAEEGVSYAELLADLLDRRDARIKRARDSQASPLHRPRHIRLDCQEE